MVASPGGATPIPSPEWLHCVPAPYGLAAASPAQPEQRGEPRELWHRLGSVWEVRGGFSYTSP